MGSDTKHGIFDRLLALLTALLFAAAALCWYASFVSPESGRFWATLGLAMPGVLLLNLAALLFWAVRGRWGLVLPPFVALIWNLGYISAMVQLPDTYNRGAAADLRVATLNMFMLNYGESPEQTARDIVRMAGREQVDILCLQEFGNGMGVSVARFGKLFADRMPYIVCDEGEAILSRYPILSHRYVRFAGSGNDYLWADLAVGKDTVRVVSVHLQTSGVSALRRRFRDDHDREAPVEQVLVEVERNSRIRARQVGEVRALIDSTRGPLILVGDFNDTPSSYTYRQFHRSLTDGFREAGTGFGSTFRPMLGVLRIDYIFYNASFRCVRYVVAPDRVSDHKAVIASLRFTE